MKKIISCLFFCAFLATSFAQKETYDLVTYTPPTGWKKEVTENIAQYSIVNKKNNSWCRIAIIKSTISKGSIEQDFGNEWQELVVKNYKPTEAPQLNEVLEADGWKIQAGAGKFTFNNSDAIVMLTTMSGFGRCVSIVATTNSQEYLKDIEALLSSVDLKKPETKPETNLEQMPVANGYTFITTRFDDGWTSTVQEDWVQVTKGSTKVLLHYPGENSKAANTDVDVVCAAVWNVLIAPRYSNIENYQVVPGVLDYQRPYLAQAYLTDNASGKKVFVVLFKRGNTGWIEIISADKNSFIENFGVDLSKVDYYVDSKIWEPLQKLAGYNKFAVAASDLKGKWTNKFTGVQQYVNAYTGANAGMDTYSSVEVFEFMAGNNYKWEAKVASGFVGNIKFQGVRSNGKLSVPNNWQIHLSEIEKKPKTYNAYFSCIKGLRILWLDDIAFFKAE